MPDSAITTSEFFVPVILVVPAFSSHQDALLVMQEIEKKRQYQQKYQYESEYIVINQNKSSIGIDEVRTLSEQLSFSVSSTHIRFVMMYHADLLTLPAQQALLKLLEEPPARTQIWLSVNTVDALIETIRSRCHIQYISKDTAIEQNEYKNVAKKLLLDIPQLSLRELTETAELYKETAQCIGLVEAVLTELTTELEAAPSAQLREATRLALKAHALLSSTNTNPRLLLESLFFSLKESRS